MSREIKFRKWAKYINGEMAMVDNDVLGGQTLYNLTKRDDDILMQYTGLKDKNGKEIYEGDIVKYRTYPYGIEEIKFEKGAFTAGEHNGSSTVTRPKLIVGRLVEIIGNIYSNPELLTN